MGYVIVRGLSVTECGMAWHGMTPPPPLEQVNQLINETPTGEREGHFGRASELARFTKGGGLLNKN